MVKNNMPDTMRDYVRRKNARGSRSRSREATLGVENAAGSPAWQQSPADDRCLISVAQIVRVSGGLILVATLLALLLAWGLTIIFSLAAEWNAFTALNQAVVQIGLGPDRGDHSGLRARRAGDVLPVCFRHTLGQRMRKNSSWNRRLASEAIRGRSARHAGTS